ncbi:MAG: hypothetical protein ACKVQC_08120, partial [Elusimicrobiota bacterium]
MVKNSRRNVFKYRYLFFIVFLSGCVAPSSYIKPNRSKPFPSEPFISRKSPFIYFVNEMAFHFDTGFYVALPNEKITIKILHEKTWEVVASSEGTHTSITIRSEKKTAEATLHIFTVIP